MTLFTIVLIYVVLASGLNIVVGFTGLLDLGYVAFYAIGGYYSAIIFVMVFQRASAWTSTPFGTSAGSTCWWRWIGRAGRRHPGLPDAAVAGRLPGHHDARVRGDHPHRREQLGRPDPGPSGISGIPKPALFAFEFDTPQRMYYLGLVLAIICLFVISRIVRSRIGRAWTAIREDEVAAESMGIHTSRYKLLSYACGRSSPA